MNLKGKITPSVFLIVLTTLFFVGCKHDEWNKHYSSKPETVDAKMWDAIQDSSKYSRFVSFMKESGYDTLLVKEQSFTLFVPTNEAFEGFDEIGQSLVDIMAYHIVPTVFLPSQIEKERKVQTYREKFALMENTSDGIYFDGIKATDNSPLFKDGTFYELDKVAYPRPNLFEFTSLYSPVLYNYINTRKVILLDKNESTPIGFDAEGNTIYDSIFVEYNFFDLLYFSSTQFEKEEIPTRFEDFMEWVDLNPSLLSLLKEPIFSIEEEYRDQAKTVLIFTQEQYEDGLNEMADKLGSKFNDYRDIPTDWQDDVLIPYFFEVGVFDSSLTYDRFLGDVLKNAQGDSVYFDHEDIDASSRFICSNGVTYNYTDFSVPDSLFNDTIWMQGEELIYLEGSNTYLWEDGVESSDASFKPIESEDPNAMEGKVLQVDFKSTYKDEFWISFKMPKVFPRSYYFRFASPWRPSGKIDVYVNGELLGTHDTYNNRRPVTGAEGRMLPDGNLNFMSWRVDNITQYGDIDVKLVYKNGGLFKSSNGLLVDYVALIPVKE